MPYNRATDTWSLNNLWTHLPTETLNSMGQSSSWEANSTLVCQEISRVFGTRRFITVFTRIRHWSLSEPPGSSHHSKVLFLPLNIHWVMGYLSPELKRPKREADHWPPSPAKVKNLWSYTSTPSYIIKSWCLIKHRNISVWCGS